MPLSMILQASGLSSTFDSLLAPYPMEKKNRNEAADAPMPKAILSSPEKPVEAPPIRNSVSK